MFRVEISVAWLIFAICLDSVTSLSCPAKCYCKLESDQYKVRCSDGDLVEVPKNLPPKTIVLDLSRNKIEVLRKTAFSGLVSLKKLFLMKNEIRVIEDGAFVGLESLTRLSLSFNKIMYFNTTSFIGPQKLRNLDLSHNSFVTLPDGMFGFLPVLRKLKLEQVPNLLCDCQLKWFVQYIKASKVDVKGQCSYPKVKKGVTLKSLKPKDMTCGPLELPVFQIHPSDTAITIVEGDHETLSCTGTWRPKSHLQWYKDSSLIDPTKLAEKLSITTKFKDEQMLITSSLKFKQLTLADTGIYKCNLSNPSGYIIGQTHLEVLSSKSKYCGAETMETNRGTFHWYDTVAKGTAHSVCPKGNINTWLKNPPRAYAWRNCSAAGNWLDIEGDQCAFSNTRTQALYRLSQEPMNSTLMVAFRSYKLRNVTSYSSEFVSKWDVIYASRTLERISHQMRDKDKKLAEDLVAVVSNMMETKSSLLTQAQSSSYRSCTSMVLVLGYFHTWFPGKHKDYKEVRFESKNIVYEANEINLLDTVGQTCAAFSRDSGKGRAVECGKWQNYTSYKPNREIEASIHFLPFTLPSSNRVARQTVLNPSFKLQFIVYRNSKLFPNVNSSRIDGSLKAVATSVVLLRIGGVSFENLTRPAVLKLKNHQHGTDPVPVHWDFKAQGGVGAWVKESGCKLSADSNSNYTIVKCYRLMNNYFAVMMIVKSAAVGQIGPPFLIHPPVYFGTALCAFLLCVTLLVYIFFRELRFNRDDAAMLMNECLALLVVVIVFVSGINNVSNTLLCRAVGVLLHYFLLCALLWVGCGGICLHRLIRTSLEPEEYNPVLRYYMISWGIPLIVCGITVAGNPDNYNVQDYCWLRPNPFLGAFLGPACLVLVVNIIVLVRLRNLIVATFDRLARAEETDLQSSEPPGEETTARSELLQRLAAIPTLPTRRDCMDHLVASGLVLVLIPINFLLAVVLVGYQSTHYLTLIFSCGYALANILLGTVIFVFHCCRKSKVKELRATMHKGQCCSRQKYTVENNVILADVAEPEASAVTAPLMNGEAGKHVYEEIPQAHHVHGATTNAGSDNVSLPSSAAITIDRQLSVEDRTVDYEPSLSDKHSCVSAPLPLKYSRHIKDHPPGHRHSYCDAESAVSPGNKQKEVKTLDFSALAPLALPESITPSSKAAHSSRESIPKHKMDSVGNKAPSEPTPSERSLGRDNLSNNKQGSRTPSEASVPPMEKRPSIPGASSELSIDGKPTYMLPRRQKPYNFVPMSSKDQPYKVVPKQLFYASPTIQEHPGRQNRPVNGVIYDFPQGSAPHNHYGTQQYQRQNYPVPVQPSDLNPRQRPRGNSTDSEVTREKKKSREGMSNHAKERHDSAKSSRPLQTRPPKEFRVKPEPKEWIPPSPKFVYVPVPHILKKQKQLHNETSV